MKFSLGSIIGAAFGFALILGAILMGLGLPLETPLPNLKMIKGA